MKQTKMKQTILLLATLLVSFYSCEKDDETDPIVIPQASDKSIYVDATSSETWHYFSFDKGEFIGSGFEDSTNNASWFARDDWDIAIKRYNVRTNSGEATSIDSQGGVYACNESITYESLNNLPNNAVFEVDDVVTKYGHGGSVSNVVMSTVQVIQFEVDGNGDKVMPPVYLQSPVYIFKNSKGTKYYKVNFTQYKNADGESGHVIFDFAPMN